MYRQYENPWALEERLAEVRAEFDMRLAECDSQDERFDIIESYSQTIAELEERVNFAWQDEEFG
jgi:hypothetical protein